MENLEGKWGLVTGASSGIGYEIALELAKQGFNLLITARSENQLIELKDIIKSTYQTKVKVFVCDLTSSEDLLKLCENIANAEIFVSVLVNNAGKGYTGSFETLSLNDHISTIQLNITALTALTHYFLIDMIRHKEGKILNVSSIISFRSPDDLTVYGSSKAYVSYFSKALSNNLNEKNIQISTLYPGLTDTGSIDISGDKQSKLTDFLMMNPKLVAEIAVKGLMKNKTYIIPGFRNKIIIFIYRIVPQVFLSKIIGYLKKN